MTKFSPSSFFRHSAFSLSTVGALGLAALCFSLTSCDKASSEAQMITLDRGAKVGDKIQFSGSANAKQVMQMTMGGTPVPQQSQSQIFTATLDGELEVLEVNENSKPSKATMQVAKLARTEEGSPEEVLLENVVLELAVAEASVSYTVAGNPIDQKAKETIELFSLMDKGASDKADEDRVFGTDQPRKPGDEWPVDGAAAAESFAKDSGMEISPEGVNGTMKFEKVEDVDGVPCQFVSGTVTMDLSSLPGLPPDAKLTNSVVTVGLSGVFPIDKSLPGVDRTQTMKMSPTVAFSVNGVAAEMKMEMEQAATSKKTLK